jgi:hypothetical protein
VTDNIVVAIPNRSASSQINAELAHFLSNIKEEDMPESGDYDVSVSFSYMQPVDANRNKIVKNFLQDEDNEYLLMIDNDVVPPKDVLQMVDYDEKVVSATVTIKKRKIPQPVIVRKKEDEFHRLTLNEYYEDVHDNGLVEVDAVGTGCVLIHRSVLEEMNPPWFQFIYNEDGTLKLGEDFYFGEKCPEPMFVSSDHVCKHYRKTDLTEFAQVVAEAENFAADGDE